MELESGEVVIWKGLPAYHLRYLILTLIFFAGIFVIKLGPVGQAIAVTSFLLWILFLIIGMVALALDKTKKYYLTNNRIISHKASLQVPDLSNVRMEQSRLGELRVVGNGYFDARDGKWIVFKHVKEPRQIVQSGLNLRGIPTGPTTTVVCSYCGARVAAGTSKCPNCGADLLEQQN